MPPELVNGAVIYRYHDYSGTKEEIENSYRLVGEALQNGAGVKSIEVELGGLWDEAGFDDEEDGASQLGEDDDDDDRIDRMMELAAPMIRYVHESTMLTALRLQDFQEYCGSEECAVAGRFLQAVLDNHQQQLKRGSIGSMEKLEIRRWAYIENSREIFANILRTCSSLRHLTIYLHDRIANWDWLTQAVQSNRSLEHVCINNEGETWIGPRIVANIVLSLSQHPRLETLSLPLLVDPDKEDEIARALGYVLHRTRSLRRLDMDWISFTVEGMGILVDGLRTNHGSFQVLHFGEYAFGEDPEECEVFMEYFKSPACEPNCLRELTYSGDRLDLLAEAMQKEGSVGSALRVLAFSSENVVQGIPGFLQSLASRGCRNWLESLTLDVGRDSVGALGQCLRSFAHLRKLKLKMYFSAGSRGWCKVVKAVKKNGSLYKVSWLPSRWRTDRVHKPGRRTRRYLKAIGRRNRLTPKLLANPRLDDHPDGADDATAESTSADTKQFPTLFLASLDAERTAPNMVLTGLLSTLDVFGHHGNGKRLHDMH